MRFDLLVTGIYVNGDLPQRRRGGGVRQQRESAAERTYSHGNRSEPRSERGHRRGAQGDEQREIQVI